jgi:hypothetical protein
MCNREFQSVTVHGVPICGLNVFLSNELRNPGAKLFSRRKVGNCFGQKDFETETWGIADCRLRTDGMGKISRHRAKGARRNSGQCGNIAPPRVAAGILAGRGAGASSPAE